MQNVKVGKREEVLFKKRLYPANEDLIRKSPFSRYDVTLTDQALYLAEERIPVEQIREVDLGSAGFWFLKRLGLRIRFRNSRGQVDEELLVDLGLFGNRSEDLKVLHDALRGYANVEPPSPAVQEDTPPQAVGFFTFGLQQLRTLLTSRETLERQELVKQAKLHGFGDDEIARVGPEALILGKVSITPAEFERYKAMLVFLPRVTALWMTAWMLVLPLTCVATILRRMSFNDRADYLVAVIVGVIVFIASGYLFLIPASLLSKPFFALVCRHNDIKIFKDK